MLKVKIDFLPEKGQSVNRILTEVAEVATKLDECVHVKINGIDMIALPRQSSKELMREYRTKLQQQITELQALLPAKQLTQI